MWFTESERSLNSAHVTHGIWTWVLFATWTWLLWQCGNQASWRLTGTRQPAMSTRGRVRWDWSTHTLWLIGSSYLPSQRFMLIHQTRDLTSLFIRTRCRTMLMKRTLPSWTSFMNIFFGDSTVFGKLLIPHVQTNPCNFVLQSLKGRQRWPGWTSFLALVASADFASESALSQLLRFSTGFQSGFARSSDPPADLKTFFLVSLFDAYTLLQMFFSTI